MEQMEARKPSTAATNGISTVAGRSFSSDHREKRKPFTVELLRVGPSWRVLGLVLSVEEEPGALVVHDLLEPSLVSEWNDTHPEAQQVRPGDIIAGVNGATGRTDQLLAKMQATGRGSTLMLDIQ